MEEITSMLLQSNIVGLQYVQQKVITILGFTCRFTVHTDHLHVHDIWRNSNSRSVDVVSYTYLGGFDGAFTWEKYSWFAGNPLITSDTVLMVWNVAIYRTFID